ncbi:thioesterase family protein [Paraburkholderia terrae]|uniref:thioesterase family protein n=1 Tax=Paraburkholderia terrae TaxID=311230 RepID=UPI003B848EFC
MLTIGQAQFVAPSKHGETLQFCLRVKEIGRNSIKLNLTARVGEDLRASLDQIVVLFSTETRQAVAVPSDLKERMLRYA